MTTTDQPLTVLPFGKHAGTPLPDVPSDYLTWLLSIKLSAGLRASVATELQARGEPVPELAPKPAPSCPRHRAAGLRYQWRTRRDGQPQIARRCSACNKHLGFAPQVEPYTTLADEAGRGGNEQ